METRMAGNRESVIGLDSSAYGEPTGRAAAQSMQAQLPQLTLGGILAVWAAAALPMAALAWIVTPRLADALTGDAAFVRALLISLTAGLVWQFVLVVALVAREQRTLRWATVRDALWLRSPVSPRSGRRGGRLWWLLLPLIAALGAQEVIPVLGHPANRDLGMFLESAAGAAFFRGAWGWFAVVLLLVIFNTVLGEELLFRGFLLPRMSGVFGRVDWLANGLLFAAYHVHVPWVIPVALLDSLILSYPTRRYRSAWMGIAVHSAQSVVIVVGVLGVVLGAS